jgi:uncharacterized membrane protein
MTTTETDATPSSAIEQLPTAIADANWSDDIVDVVDSFASVVVADPTRKSLFQGGWLGHPLHPMLTDVPIGFWTAATVLDFVGGRQMRPASQRLVALGLLSVPMTVAAGLADFAEFDSKRKRRVAAVHAAGNASATGAYFASWLARRRGHHLRGALLALVGAMVATGAGYLGGHLSFGDVGDDAPEPSEVEDGEG